jgi:glycosyltransferase involved in cell wall biosynthesis
LGGPLDGIVVKLLYLSNSAFPSRLASSVHVMKMCAAFAAHGCDVTLASYTNTGLAEKTSEDEFRYYGVSASFRHIKGRSPRLLTRIPVLRSVVRLVFCGLACHKVEPDVVYGRDVFSTAVATVLRFPVVLELHQPVIGVGRGLGAFFRRHAFRLTIQGAGFRGLVVVSEQLRAHYEARYPGLFDSIVVAHDGADPPQEPVVRPLPGLGAFNVGYAGNLFTGKGVEVIVGLAAACPWASFHVVGGLDSDVRHWQEKSAGLANLRYHAYVPHSEVRSILENFDIVLAPYQSVVYGFKPRQNIAAWMSPLKIFEYMAAGRAIICSDLPVLREVLTDGETARLCHPERLDEWRRAVEELRESPELRRELGKAAQRVLIERYTWTGRGSRIAASMWDRRC